MRMKDTLGKSIIIGIILLCSTAAMSMDTRTMMMMWGNLYNGAMLIGDGVLFIGDAILIIPQ